MRCPTCTVGTRGGIVALEPSVTVVLANESMSWGAVVALALLYLTAPTDLLDAQVDGARFHRLAIEIGAGTCDHRPRRHK